MSDEPQSTTAWAKGADGERRLAARLNRDLAAHAIVLHDRRVPGSKGNIDHLVIASSGVWVVDAKNYAGKVELRDAGGWSKTDIRLYVGGRDRTKAVDGLSWQVESVRSVMAPVGFADAPIHRALCFTDAEWPLLAKPAQVKEVWVIWAKKLCEKILQPGPFAADIVQLVACELSGKLPAAK
jgi:hypothetical protein